MSFRLGLTGSIGMGKSSTAQMFADLGCPVWDADAAVHRLYSKGGAAVDPLKALYPEVILDDQVSREGLKELILKDKTVISELERIVHPLVRKDREIFVANAQEEILVFDIPLLFETGADVEMDATVCVSTSASTQKERVLSRGTMSEAQLDAILSRQMPSEEKCARATYVIETDSFEHARAQVDTIFKDILNRSKGPFDA